LGGHRGSRADLDARNVTLNLGRRDKPPGRLGHPAEPKLQILALDRLVLGEIGTGDQVPPKL
jgi:hypothetical protein